MEMERVELEGGGIGGEGGWSIYRGGGEEGEEIGWGKK